MDGAGDNLGGSRVTTAVGARNGLGRPATGLGGCRAGANNGGSRGLVADTGRVVAPAVVLAAVGLAITVLTVVLDVLAPLGKAVAVQVGGPLRLLEARVDLKLTNLPCLETSRLVGPSRQRGGTPLTTFLLTRSRYNRGGSADTSGSAGRLGLASGSPGLGGAGVGRWLGGRLA